MFRITVLGTSSAMPVHGRHLSSQAVVHNERLYLVDCGEGTQFQLQRYRIRLRALDAVFISHLHGDHVYGLPGLITSLNLSGRTEPLRLFGPPELEPWLRGIFQFTEAKSLYPLHFHSWDGPSHEPLFETPSLEVLPLPLVHRVPTRGFLFREKPKRRRFLASRAFDLGVPVEYFRLLKQENTIALPDGRTIGPDDVLGPAPPSFQYAYCSDTNFQPPLAQHVQGVDLLYHEATFRQDLLARATETQHSTAQQAAEIARMAGAKRLLMGHFSARYTDLNELLAEAQAVFPGAELAQEGVCYTIGDSAAAPPATEPTHEHEPPPGQ